MIDQLRSHYRHLATAALTICLLAGTVFAVPSLISYQGRLTTTAGQAVADSVYTVVFAVYPESTGGVALWQETANVHTTNGLFSHLLGSETALLPELFGERSDLFVELTVMGETIMPRTRLAAAAFARAAADLRVTDDRDTAIIVTDGVLHTLTVNGVDGRRRAEISGEQYGLITLLDSAGPKVTAELSATPDSGGRLSLYDVDGAAAITLRGGLSGDNAVQLPDSAISADEILNESGIVTAVNTSQIPIPTGFMKDLVTIDLTIPDDGFIHLSGKCYVLLSGTTGPNSAVIQIDLRDGGSTDFPYYQQVGLSGYVNTGVNYFPVYVERTYFAQAGTYEFRMEGRAENPLPAEVKSWDHILTATYYPSEYGAVSSVLMSPDGFPSAQPVDDPRTDSLGQRWEVDLRDARSVPPQ